VDPDSVDVSVDGGIGRRSVLDGKLQTLETDAGEVIERREDPEAMFLAAPDGPWDDMQAAYFASEALWTYLTTPFLYTYPGFEAVEVEPWHENGEVWRSLEVTFPDSIASHTRTQTCNAGTEPATHGDRSSRRAEPASDLVSSNASLNHPVNHRHITAGKRISVATVRRSVGSTPGAGNPRQAANEPKSSDQQQFSSPEPAGHRCSGAVSVIHLMKTEQLNKPV
jgi:hypothetical protein